MPGKYKTYSPEFRDEAARLVVETSRVIADVARGAWLRGIAKNQCRAVRRRRNQEGDFPEKDLEDAEYEVRASRRQVQVDRMLDRVAASFTQRQQVIFQLVLRQGIRGQALAAELGVSEKEANDVTYENQVPVLAGFGAVRAGPRRPALLRGPGAHPGRDRMGRRDLHPGSAAAHPPAPG